MNELSWKYVFTDGQKSKHAKCVHGWTNGQTCTFHERTSLLSLPTYKKGPAYECNIKRAQWPSNSLCLLPCQGEVVTNHEDIHHQQHCSSTCTLATAQMHQHCHVESCLPHIYCGPYYQSMYCNMEVQDTILLYEESCMVENLWKSNSRECSWTATRVSFILGYK